MKKIITIITILYVGFIGYNNFSFDKRNGLLSNKRFK